MSLFSFPLPVLCLGLFKNADLNLLSNCRMLEYLKKQVFEYRSKNFLLRSDLNEMKVSHNRLLEQYSSLTSSYEALRQQSSSFSQSNKKLLGQSTDSKKELYETKKELKISLFNHKVEMRKLTDLMKAKDKDNAETIAYLQAQVASLQSIPRNNSNRDFFNRSKPKSSGTFSSSRRKSKQEPPKKMVSSLQKASPNQNKSDQTKAKFGRKSSKDHFTPIVSIDDDEWGHDGYYAMNGSTPRSSPVSISSSSNSFALKRQSLRQNRRSKKTVAKDSQKASENKARVVTPGRKPTSPISRVSNSSLKEATTKMKDQNSGAKQSSLAAAATKKSSLALKAKSK